MIELWQIAKTVWKVSGACLLIFLLCITKDERKVETFNSFGKRFGNVGETAYVIIVNILFYGGILLCVADAVF